jgi:DNA-binding beta-propeller fold protein YncE
VLARSPRLYLALVAALACAGVLLALDGSGSPPREPKKLAATVKPVAIYPGPRGLVAGAAPQPNGYMWLLAESGTTATLQELDLATHEVASVVPESSAARAIAQSPSGVVAVGLGTRTTGAVELRNGSSGALLATVPVGAPVKAVYAGADGSTLYVLDATASSASVTLVSLTSDQTSTSVPVPLGTVSIVVDPAEQHLFALTASGVVDEVNIGDGSVAARFDVGSGAIGLAISSTGARLYVLKSAGSATNVGVVDVATERQLAAVPAPSGCAAIQVSPNGQSIYDVVGTSAYGNVQVFPLGT